MIKVKVTSLLLSMDMFLILKNTSLRFLIQIKSNNSYMWLDQFEGQFHVLDVGLINAELDSHWVKHMEHHVTSCLGVFLKDGCCRHKHDEHTFIMLTLKRSID